MYTYRHITTWLSPNFEGMGCWGCVVRGFDVVLRVVGERECSFFRECWQNISDWFQQDAWLGPTIFFGQNTPFACMGLWDPWHFFKGVFPNPNFPVNFSHFDMLDFRKKWGSDLEGHVVPNRWDANRKWWEDFTSVMVHEQLRYSCSAEEMSGGETWDSLTKWQQATGLLDVFFVAKWYSVFEGEDLGKNVGWFLWRSNFVPTSGKNRQTCKLFANRIRWIKLNHFDIQKEIRPNSNFPFQKVCHIGSVLSFSQLRMSNFPSNLSNSSPKLDTPWSIFWGSELRQGYVSKHSLKIVSETQILL